MKTGKVAKLFGIDPKTVTGWVEEFAEFFSDSAKAEEGSLQRDYLPEDLIVLNTVKNERAARTDVEAIRAKLRSGHRDTVLPPESAYIDKDNALAVYGQLKILQAEVERLRAESQIATERNEADRVRHEQREAELNNEIRKLERENGGLAAELRLLREQLREKNDGQG